MNINLRQVIDVFGGTPAVVGAVEAFGDCTRWRDVADLNKIDVLADAGSIKSIELPSGGDVFGQVKPLLTSVSEGLNNAGALAKISPQIAGYVSQAQKLIGEANGVIGKAESIYGTAQTAIKSRDYKEAIRLVDWLL